MFTVKNFALLAGGVALSAASLPSASAQEVEAIEDINNGAISFSLGADVVSKYIFRGFELEEDGLIVQPYAEFVAGIADGIDIYAGIWNSVHSNTQGDNNTKWFEADIYAGVSIGEAVLGVPFALDINYTNYTSPNDAFGQYEEIGVTLAYDDSSNAVSFDPYALVAFEFGTDTPGDDDNIYLELGGSFAFELIESETYPVSLEVPLTLGLSLDEFYVDDSGDNEFFGFFSIGGNLSVPLEFIPREYGQWSASAGLTLFLLNDNAVGLDDGDNENFNIAASLGFALEY